VGLLDDVTAFVRSWFTTAGDRIALLGSTTGELGGSELLASRGVTAGRPPKLHVDREIAVQGACRELVRKRLVRSAHDCSEGGLAVSIAEACMMGPLRLGAKVKLPTATARPDLDAFSEEPSRILVSYAPAQEAEVKRVAQSRGAAFSVLGDVGGDRLELEGLGGAGVAELAEAYRAAFPALFAR
jgi:phosphoribosylformylglycinamidine synthase